MSDASHVHGTDPSELTSAAFIGFPSILAGAHVLEVGASAQFVWNRALATR